MREKLPLIVALVFLFLCIGVGAALGDESAKLATLKPLPKPLMSWGTSNFDSEEELRQWTRVTLSCPISLAWSSSEQIKQCAKAVASITPKGTVAVSYSPLVREYNRLKKLYGDDPARFEFERVKFILDLGERWDAEREKVRKKLLEIKDAVGVSPVVVMYDHEYSVINEITVPVLCHKLNILGDLAREHGFGVLFYNYRAQREAPTKTGWSEFEQVPVCVRSDWASVSLYWPEQTHHMREAMRRTLASQEQDVVPWVSFGWTWRRVFNGRSVGRAGQNDYDEVHAKMMASDLHAKWKALQPRFYDNRRVPFVFMWPGVDHKLGKTTSFWRHFYAYHSGATQ